MRFSVLLFTILVSLHVGIAKHGHAQDWEMVWISIEAQEAKLVDIFEQLEKKTTYSFRFDPKITRDRGRYTLDYQETNLKTILKDLADQASLLIKLRNSTISVLKQTEAQPAEVIVIKKSDTEVSGLVLDARTQEPLVGATVRIKGTSIGAMTNEQGRFTVAVPDNSSILVISYLGYEIKEFSFEGQTNLQIMLTARESDLDEVVVIGYGTQKKINLIGAVSRIEGSDFDNRPITQASQALQGLAPGMFINMNSGEPGNDQANIIIRGVGTLNNANPLILVDGIEAPINSVDPNDIESINVLKDAASASIYGSRAANGVILITTKKGDFNEKASINYDAYVGISSPTVLPDMVWDNRTYLELYREAAINSGRNFGFDDADIARYDALPSTNWMEEMVDDNAPITSHNLALKGGNEKINYYFSNGYLFQKGFLAGKNEYGRFSSRLNLNGIVNNKIRFGTSLAYFNEDGYLTPKDRTGRSFANKGSLVFSGAMIQHPLTPVFDQFGRYGSLEAALGVERNRPSGQGVADNETIDLKGNDLLGKAFLEYEPIENLIFKGTFGVNYQDEIITDVKREYVTYDPVTGDPWTNGNGTRNRGSTLFSQNQKSFNVTAWLQGSYKIDFGQHSLGVLAGFNREKATIDQVEVLEREFGTKDVISLGQGALVQTDGGRREWGLVSVFGRISYDFADRYLFEVNLRRDASSRFGENNRWATFPSLSGGWVLSNEAFWDKSFISFLKLRASWGKLGNQSSNLYPFASQVGLGENYHGNAGAALVRLGNPDLRWEETTTTNIGVDVKFLNDRLSLEADYFTKLTEDILTDLQNPLTSGIAAPTTVNAASIENKGWELAVNYKDLIGDFFFSVSANVTHVQNEVTAINPSLADNDDRIQLSRADNIWIIRGQPIYSIFGHKVEGIFQSEEEIANAPDHSFIGSPAPGDFRYTDTNGDGVITAEDQTVIGNRQPEWLYGANFKLSFKGFELSGLVQGIGKTDVWIARMYGPFPFAGIRSFWRDNRWTPENPSETVPRLWVDRRGYNGASIESGDKQNSFWVQNRAYIRLKNLQLSYTLPAKVLENTPLQNLRFYLNGDNLWTETDLLDIDPERFSRETHATNVIPQSKTLTIGVNATF